MNTAKAIKKQATKKVVLKDPPFCFGCSEHNEVSLKVFNFEHEILDKEAFGFYVFTDKYATSLGYVHPGIVAALLREVMGNLANKTGKFNLITDLQLKFLRIIYPEYKIGYKVFIEKKDRKQIVIEGIIFDPEKKEGDKDYIFVQAKGVFSFSTPRKIDELFEE